MSNGTTTDPAELLALYTNFIADFESKLNQLTLAQIAVAIAHRQGPLKPKPKPGIPAHAYATQSRHGSRRR